MNFPFTEEKKNGSLIREFSSNVSSEELTWHRDHSDRIVKVQTGSGWQLQMENSLPIDLVEGRCYRIPACTYHRVIKGSDTLIVEIVENALNGKQSLLNEYIKQIFSEGSRLVPTNMSMSEWESYKKKNKISAKAYDKKAKTKWKITHGPGHKDAGKTIKKNTGLTYSKAKSIQNAFGGW